jgi:hypothetical protein
VQGIGSQPVFWNDGGMDTAEGPAESGAQTPGITRLGHDVYEIDTRMAGYPGITAGYLILGDRPCLVETGTAPSAPVVGGALAVVGGGATPKSWCTSEEPGTWPTRPG